MRKLFSHETTSELQRMPSGNDTENLMLPGKHFSKFNRMVFTKFSKAPADQSFQPRVIIPNQRACLKHFAKRIF